MRMNKAPYLLLREKRINRFEAAKSLLFDSIQFRRNFKLFVTNTPVLAAVNAVSAAGGRKSVARISEPC